MKKSDYTKERLDPRWQKRRLEIMERDLFSCIDCGSPDKTLHVHHTYYVTGRKCWEYPGFSLSTLCDECHKQRHHYQTHEMPEFRKGMEEWEMELDWILKYNPQNQGMFWHLAAEIACRLAKIKAPNPYRVLQQVLEDMEAIK